MKVTQIRNATVLLEFEADGLRICLLVDPMLAAAGQPPALRLLGRLTHCQRGHFDHLDRKGTRFLRERSLPVFCMPRDIRHLQRQGLRTLPLGESGRQRFFNGWITPVPCVHGRGLVGRLMEHGSGYLIEIPSEPSVYLAGDTLLTSDVRALLAENKPDIAILPAGGARLDVGGAILMDAEDVLEACSLVAGMVVANHLEALDHCPTQRAALAAKAVEAGVSGRLIIPRDGESLQFSEPQKAIRQTTT